MKPSSLLKLAAVLCCGTLLFSSCANFGKLSIEKRHYRNGFYVHTSGKTETKATEKVTVENTAALVNEKNTDAQKPVLQNGNTPAQMVESGNGNFPFVFHPATGKAVKQNSVSVLPAEKTAKEKQPVKAKIKSILHNENPSQPAGDVDQIILLILAILIPPLAIYLKEGLTNRFWIDLICYLVGGGLFLTPFFYGGGLLVFAVVFAILIVLDVI